MAGASKFFCYLAQEGGVGGGVDVRTETGGCWVQATGTGSFEGIVTIWDFVEACVCWA